MRIFFVSLGCDKTRVDSEVMLGTLVAHGHIITDDEDTAEAAVINTCCFIGDSKKESVDTILEFAERKTSGQLKALIVAGCLAQRYREEVLDEIPEVDACLGISAASELADVLDEIEKKGSAKDRLRIYPLDVPPLTGKRIQTTGGHYNFLRIAEGCDKNCTYCVIPSIRGHYRSLPIETLLHEAQELVNEGVRELILIAQETTCYGTDLYGRKALPELIRALAKIEELRWIRLMYCYPEEIDDELINVLKTETKLCHYLDMPIQSGSDDVLRRMGRRTTRDEIISIVKKLRAEIPDICIRTTFITGFPGETAADHRASEDMVRELRFDRLGVFTYSQEEGTPAADFPDQIGEPLKKRRRTRLMKLQQEIAFEKAEQMKGMELDVVVEGRVDEDGEDIYVSRTWKDAPDIDGYLFIENAPYELLSGSFVKVRVTGAADYDLIGEIV